MLFRSAEVGAVSTGVVGELLETGAAVATGGDGVAAFGAHPHTSTIRPGSKGHCSSGTRPVWPATSSVAHDNVGPPAMGTVKSSSGFVTAKPSPQTEQPPSGGEVVGVASTGATGA